MVTRPHLLADSSSLTRHYWSLTLLFPGCAPGKGGLGSTKFVAFETLAWHNDCFYCHICQDSMVGKGFIQDGDNIICPECARKKMIEEIEEA